MHVPLGAIGVEIGPLRLLVTRFWPAEVSDMIEVTSKRT